MVEATIPSPVEAPPPAYEITQQDFDQKLAITAERSLELSERQREPGQDGSAEEGKDERDEAARQANVSRRAEPQHTVHVNGQCSTVRPLNFRKKARNSNVAGALTKDKERPSWFNEAQLGASSSNSSASGRPLPALREPHDQDRRSTQHILPEEPEYDRSFPPPPFVAVDTSLDGPAYERYARNDSRRRRTGAPTVVLHYTGEDLAASPPPSPPHSPVMRNSSPGMHFPQRVASPQINPVNSVYQHAPQQLRLQVRTPVPRPTSAGSQHYMPPPPRLNFDPSVAYEGTNSSIFRQLPVESKETGQDVAALYSSAVAPHMSSQKSRPTTAPKVKRYASSISSLPEYEQRQLQQSASSAKPLYAVQEYAASRASVYSQSSVNHIPQYPQIAQYPQMAQYPAQQTYTRPMSVVQQGDRQRWASAGAQYQSQCYQG